MAKWFAKVVLPFVSRYVEVTVRLDEGRLHILVEIAGVAVVDAFIPRVQEKQEVKL